jgi:hypothetical protein
MGPKFDPNHKSQVRLTKMCTMVAFLFLLSHLPLTLLRLILADKIKEAQTTDVTRTVLQVIFRQKNGRMARSGHGLPEVSPRLAMPYPYTPCDRATPETW